MDPKDDKAVLDTTVELRRTQRILRSTLESTNDERLPNAISSLEPTEISSVQKQKKEYILGNKNEVAIDPLIAYGWQRLLNVICSVFASDWNENNELFISQNIKCNFSRLKVLGTGTNFMVRKLPEIPTHHYHVGYLFSARGTRRNLDVINGTSKPPLRVSKQIRVARWRGQGRKSAAILQNVIIEIQVLNHHPIMMHENIIDFLGVLWEYDIDRQVWPVLCLEFADKGTLNAFIDQPFILTFAQKMELCLDVGNGIRALHGCGVVHGDIKIENVFIFSHPERGYIAKLGDFSSSTMSFSLGDLTHKLYLGGYTPLWVAPEYSGPATFGALRAMDVFSFGMLVWTVVQNGKSVLAALASSVPPPETDAFLKSQKASPDFVSLAKRAVQLPGYCEDILIEDFGAILEYTLGPPQSRDLDFALETLRRVCKSDRTGERSPLRPIQDLDSNFDGSQSQNFDFKVIKNFPRPLQRQILETKRQRMLTTQKPFGTELFGHDSTLEAMQMFQMVHESMGGSTLGEEMLYAGATEHDVRRLVEQGGDSASNSDTAQTQRKAELEKRHSTSSAKLLEQLIIGSICSGPSSFGPSRYRGYANQKHVRCVELLTFAIREEMNTSEILPHFEALACLLTLGWPQWLTKEIFEGWIKYAHFGLFSLLNRLGEDNGYEKKLEVLQLAAEIKDVISIVETDKAFNKLTFEISSSVDKQLLVDNLRAKVERPRGNRLDSGEYQPRRVFDLAPFVDKIPIFQEQLVHSTIEEVNYQDNDGRTPLIVACSYGNLEAARLLLSHGANAALSSRTGQNAFHCLPYIDPLCQSEFARELLEAGADPNARITTGGPIRGVSSAIFPAVLLFCGTPLHHAILNNSLGSVTALVSCGANGLQEDSQYLTPLALAASAHCAEILDALIQSTKTNVRTWLDHFGNSLVYAALDGEWNMLRMYLHLDRYYQCADQTLTVLQTSNANWDNVSARYNVPALRFASFYSSSFMVSRLLDKGLQNQVNLDVPSIPWPLHQAILRGDEHIFLLLLDQGADVHVRSRSSGDSCLHACIKADFDDHFFIEVLLDRGAEIDTVNNNGRTAFYEAVIRKQFRTATYLLSRGANPEHKDVLGLSVLGSVLEDGDDVVPCIQYLLEPRHPFPSSDFVVGRNNSTALHAAAGVYNTSRTSTETKQLFDYLLKKFPYEEHLESQETTSGFTPLMIAVLDNNIDATRALLDAGASLDTKCLAGYSLRRAEFLAKLVIASADGLIPGLDFDEIHGGRAWRDMMKLLLEASIRPDIKPKVALIISPQEARRSRVERFVGLVRGSDLPCLASQFVKDDVQVTGLPAPDDPDQSLLSETEAPEPILAEMEVHLNEQVLSCPVVANPAGYILQRDNEDYYFVPNLCWVTETETLGTKGSLGEVLNTFPAFPVIGITFCKHIVDGLSVVHAAGFTHGALNMSAVIMRTLTSGPSTIPSIVPQLCNIKSSASNNTKDALCRKQGNEFDAPELRNGNEEFQRPFNEMLKCDIFSLGMVIVRSVAARNLNDLGTFESNPSFVSSAIGEVRAAMVEAKYGTAVIEKLIQSLGEMLEPDPVKRTPNLDGIRSAIESVLNNGRQGSDEESSNQHKSRFFGSMARRRKRLGH